MIKVLAFILFFIPQTISSSELGDFQIENKTIYLNRKIEIKNIFDFDKNDLIFHFKDLKTSKTIIAKLNSKMLWINYLKKEFFSKCPQTSWTLSFKLWTIEKFQIIPNSAVITVERIEIMDKPKKHPRFCFEERNFFVWFQEEIKNIDKHF